MGEKINDGGPAFPRPFAVSNGGLHEHQVVEEGHGGMSLRDWFAGMALQGLLSDPNYNELPEHSAPLAYAYSDALLRARSAETGGES